MMRLVRNLWGAYRAGNGGGRAIVLGVSSMALPSRWANATHGDSSGLVRQSLRICAPSPRCLACLVENCNQLCRKHILQTDWVMGRGIDKCPSKLRIFL